MCKPFQTTFRNAEPGTTWAPRSIICQNPCWLIFDRIEDIYMVLCGNCGKNVKPSVYFSWNAFIRGLGILYFIYFMTKIPQCPNCNFPMPRRSMVFAIQPLQYFIKLARMNILQLAQFRERAISTSWRYYLNRKFDLTRHFASMNTHQTTSFNMVNEVHNTISLDSCRFRK